MTLKAKQIENFSKAGMYADGQGLYLRVQGGGSKGAVPHGLPGWNIRDQGR